MILNITTILHRLFFLFNNYDKNLILHLHMTIPFYFTEKNVQYDMPIFTLIYAL